MLGDFMQFSRSQEYICRDNDIYLTPLENILDGVSQRQPFGDLGRLPVNWSSLSFSKRLEPSCAFRQCFDGPAGLECVQSIRPRLQHGPPFRDSLRSLCANGVRVQRMLQLVKPLVGDLSNSIIALAFAYLPKDGRIDLLRHVAARRVAAFAGEFERHIRLAAQAYQFLSAVGQVLKAP
jgi:hypothetical protein